MTSGGSVAAVDLGATSGRVIVGHVDSEGVRLRHAARFPNTPVTVREGDRDAVRWKEVAPKTSCSASSRPMPPADG